jgi:hypothetical protein
MLPTSRRARQSRLQASDRLLPAPAAFTAKTFEVLIERIVVLALVQPD